MRKPKRLTVHEGDTVTLVWSGGERTKFRVKDVRMTATVHDDWGITAERSQGQVTFIGIWSPIQTRRPKRKRKT